MSLCSWIVLVSLSSFSSVLAQKNPLSSPLGPVVDIGYAAFAGNSTSPAGQANTSVTFFGGIPFAQPPLGNLRWRAPQMLDESGMASTVTDARSWGPACIQFPATVGIGTEDCLKLNVWKPTNASEGDNLPVIGGGFYAGSPQGFPLYDWVDQHPTGLVGVSIAYRLGMMGFFGGPTIPGFTSAPFTDSSESSSQDLDPQVAHMNVGLLDQRAGLEWVQRHITKFGGDPDNVSIYGESAGGASMVMQVTAYGGTKPVPFKRVTAESIGFNTRTDAEIELIFANATEFIGCPASGPDTLPCMRNASVGAIVSTINRTPEGFFSPVPEGPNPNAFMPDLPSRLIRSGNFSTVEFNGGHCTNDGTRFAGGTPDQFQTPGDVKRMVLSGISNETQDQALALYPIGPEFPTEWDVAWNIAGQEVFACMDWLLAEALVAKGVENVFSYRWNAPDTVLYNANPYLGAMHTSDLYYLFDGRSATFCSSINAGNTFAPFNTSEAVLAHEAIAFWTSFGTSGDPSSSKLAISPSWEKFVSENGQMQFTRGNDSMTASGMETIPQDEIQRCKFWMSEEVTQQIRV
ncbi:alpha/beta-hydrolase [Dendrothele bispora CBS 962.96]|uniref:Carboxylic ester hydrolase n=1 Tax=Dendrothele bispora (strain CBS 962.96) TaxID=1314807 RepID=A0A4S8M285_DENBC|nr:alpha/beta-hydrolase [Dendrothele bispora CBS 962.96]